jgi:hypothetical protein
VARHLLVQPDRVARRAHDLYTAVAKQRRHSVANERRVVGDHDAQRPLAALAPAHLMDGQMAGEPRQAHVAFLTEAQVGRVARQLAHERGGEHLPRASWIATAHRTASIALRNAIAAPPASGPISTPQWCPTSSLGMPSPERSGALRSPTSTV